MRNRKISPILSILLAFLLVMPLLGNAAAAREPEADWAWLVKQVKSGKKTIVLPNNIVREGDEGLVAESAVIIEGGTFSITDCAVDAGRITFHDVALRGTHGIRDESGTPGLVLRGDGAIAILSGTTLVEGGRSGPAGERGGDGVLLEGKGQGVLLYNKALATGGTGHFMGGSAIRVLGCESSVLIGEAAAGMGKGGLAEGGWGIDAPSCASISVLENGSATGGASPYAAGGGVRSHACEACKVQGLVSVRDNAILTGAVGSEGGNAISIERNAAGKEPDLSIEGNAVLIGGGGGKAGAAILGKGSSIAYTGSPMLFSGNYYETEAKVRDLTRCKESGDKDAIVEEAGVQVTSYPASNVTTAIRAELDRKNPRSTPDIIEGGLATMELASKMNGLAVDKGRVSRMKLNDQTLLITMFDGTLENRLQYTPRLMELGEEEMRLVLIASTSHEWVTVESTVAALRKLHSLGVTQFAYTTVEPSYCERIIDIGKLLDVIEKEAEPPETIMLGTADDAVMYPKGKKERIYQEGLMEKVLVDLPQEDVSQ